MAFPVACIGDTTDPEFGPPGVILTGATTVLAGGRPVAVLGESTVAPHGNPYNPHAPGFNPTCAQAIVTIPAAPGTVFAEGKPVATLQSTCSCTLHQIEATGCPTVLIGP